MRQKTDRNEEIFQLKSRGMSNKDLKKRFGISEGQIGAIFKRQVELEDEKRKPGSMRILLSSRAYNVVSGLTKDYLEVEHPTIIDFHRLMTEMLIQDLNPRLTLMQRNYCGKKVADEIIRVAKENGVVFENEPGGSMGVAVYNTLAHHFIHTRKDLQEFIDDPAKQQWIGSRKDTEKICAYAEQIGMRKTE